MVTRCALTGSLLQHPVVSTKTGHVFEKAAIEKEIESTGKCPITGVELTKEDILDVNVPEITKPRGQTGTSIPGMLSLLRSEWDSLMLEIKTLKDHLNTTRQELSQALYQHEAACRVICRLLKERDEAQTQLAKLVGLSQVEEKKAGLEAKISEEFTQLSEALAETRKARKVPADLAKDEEISGFSLKSTISLHPPSENQKGGITSLDISKSDLLLTGGKDGTAKIFSLETNTVINSVTHNSKVTKVSFVPKMPLLFITCTEGSVATLYKLEDEKLPLPPISLYPVLNHKASITDCSVHPHGEYCMFSSKDGSWSFHDLSRKALIQSVTVPEEVSIHCGKIHPDGLMVATGLKDGKILIWDIRIQEQVHTLEQHAGAVKRIEFSGNGYQMASCSKEGNPKIWDLRKLATEPPVEIKVDEKVNSIAFDAYGGLLGVAGNVVEVYKAKRKVKLAGFSIGEMVTDLIFGKDNRSILLGTKEGNLTILS